MWLNNISKGYELIECPKHINREVCNKGKTGWFAKISFHFLRADKSNICNMEITGKPVSFGDGEKMQVLCILYFEGLSAYSIDILKGILPDN